ncbi:MAG: uracil-DNA glycosylase [Phycisphaerales bacterium]|jgi:uracil-DNA glycosylase family 4
MTRARHALLQADRAMGLSHAPRRREADPLDASVPASLSEPAPGVPALDLPIAERASAPATPSGTARAIPAPVAHGGIAVRGVEALEALRQRHDRECPHCTTATAHTQTVFGEGDPEARLMFIGEAPGETEDRLGRPFVGRAGEKLDEMIRAMGLGREQVYIANVLKSRPPENRTPLQHEVDACGPYLIEQILTIRPEVIVTLGGPATKLLLATDVGITRLRGVWSEWRSPGGEASIPVMPTYHPAYLLRNYTPQTRGEMWSDLQAVMARLGLGRK